MTCTTESVVGLSLRPPDPRGHKAQVSAKAQQASVLPLHEYEDCDAVPCSDGARGERGSVWTLLFFSSPPSFALSGYLFDSGTATCKARWGARSGSEARGPAACREQRPSHHLWHQHRGALSLSCLFAPSSGIRGAQRETSECDGPEKESLLVANVLSCRAFVLSVWHCDLCCEEQLTDALKKYVNDKVGSAIDKVGKKVRSLTPSAP